MKRSGTLASLFHPQDPSFAVWISYLGIAVIFISMFGAIVFSPKDASAVTGADFKAGRIIDDVVFYNDSSMDTVSIQSFLNSKVPTCDTNGELPASDFGRSDITRAEYAALVGWQSPPYTCLRNYIQDTPQMEAASGLCGMISAGIRQTGAKIINDVAKACNISPQVLLVLLQKEQALILDTWPLDSQYRNATGFACPDGSPCDPSYNGFFYQVYYAARQFQIYKNFPNSYNYIAGRDNNIYFNPELSSCGSSTVYIENQATAALYIYTPYQPNQAALSNLYGTGDSCSAYGNRNFWRLFIDWFGSPYGYMSAGVNYSDVFNADYYLANNSDVLAQYGNSPTDAFYHFIQYGISEGRQGSENFDLISYRNRYPDLRIALGTNYKSYYLHYISNGKKEGRISTGEFIIQYITYFKGINYSSVYDYRKYVENYTDLRQSFQNDDAGAIKHFAAQGINEGRLASSSYNVSSYKGSNFDLRRVLGDDTKAYYLHYLNYGKSENRLAVGNFLGGTTVFNNRDYSRIYSFDTYAKTNSDIKSAFNLDDQTAIKHFVEYGMTEGRSSSSGFSALNYKNRYSDLRAAYGNDLKYYYLHFLFYGYDEGRIGT